MVVSIFHEKLGHTFAFQKMRVFFQITKKHDFFFKTKSHMFNKAHKT